MGRIRVRTGLLFDLPTKNQWRYACRAGTETQYSFGDMPDVKYMWYKENSGGHTHPVGRKLPNPWGLYDMHGNVAEWCLENAGDGQRINCGGVYCYSADRCASLSRYQDWPSAVTDTDVGFRLVLNLTD